MKCLTTAAAILCVISGIAPAEDGQPEFVRAVEGMAEFQLDNGLQVQLFPAVSSPKVTVNLTVFVGSRHKDYRSRHGTSAWAHGSINRTMRCW